MMSFTGRHILPKNMSYWRVCNIGGHVLQFRMSRRSKCFTGRNIIRMIYLTGEHVLHEGRLYWKVCLIGSHAYM